MIMVMEIYRVDSPRTFLEEAGPLLGAAEAEHNLILGVVRDMVVRPQAHRGERYLAVVRSEGGEVVATAMMTPPFPLAITRLPDGVAQLIVDDLKRTGMTVSGVLGVTEHADRVVAVWPFEPGTGPALRSENRIYQLDCVVPVDRPPGSFRCWREDELEQATRWVALFYEEAAAGDRVDHEALATRTMKEGRLFVWDDRGPVSMAGWVRDTGRATALSLVYTPSEHRRRGYGTACVAAASQRALDERSELCVLYADLANSTSNSIYQRIGYRPVCDVRRYDFIAKE